MKTSKSDIEFGVGMLHNTPTDPVQRPVYGVDKPRIFTIGKSDEIYTPVQTVEVTQDMDFVSKQLSNLRTVRQSFLKADKMVQLFYENEMETLDEFIMLLEDILAQGLKDDGTYAT